MAMGKNLKSDAYEGGLTVDPSILPGVPATVGAVFLRVGTTEVWQKFGAADTDWIRITVPGLVLVFRPGGVAGGNVFTNWAALVAAASLVQGQKIIQFDDSIVTPCVIPAGVWNMSQAEWFGNANNDTGAFVAITVADGASFTNLRRVSGKINITNLNTVNAPVMVAPVGPSGRVLFEVGRGLNDSSQINNTGAAPFFDCTSLVAGQLFLLRVSGQISGTSPAIQFGASAGALGLALFEARINAGMIAGTNPVANINCGLFYGSVGFARQSAWAGSIRRGIPNLLPSANTAGHTSFVRTLMFPAPQNQVSAPPSTVFLTPATGLGHNVTMRFNATLGAIAQVLPVIRATAPAIGAQPQVTPGVLNSEGMIVIVRDFGTGPTQVSLTPAAGESIEGVIAGVLPIPVGGSRILQSDGISDWRVIAGYL